MLVEIINNYEKYMYKHNTKAPSPIVVEKQ